MEATAPKTRYIVTVDGKVVARTARKGYAEQRAAYERSAYDGRTVTVTEDQR